MPFMILAHPRSKSTLLSECFRHQNYLGEIFNLNIVDPGSFLLNPEVPRKPEASRVLWRQEWSGRYLRHLEELIANNSEAVFKVFYEHVVDSDEALALIKKINPTILSIHRKDGLKAVKSHLVAIRRGFSERDQVESVGPFHVTKEQFSYSYQVCVKYPRTARRLFQAEWSTTYEDFNYRTFPYLQVNPRMRSQESEEMFHLILNQFEVDTWFREAEKTSAE